MPSFGDIKPNTQLVIVIGIAIAIYFAWRAEARARRADVNSRRIIGILQATAARSQQAEDEAESENEDETDEGEDAPGEQVEIVGEGWDELEETEQEEAADEGNST